MSQAKFIDEYGDAIVAYEKLQMLVGEEKAKDLLEKMIEQSNERDRKCGRIQ